jgi:hypothetical protein
LTYQDHTAAIEYRETLRILDRSVGGRSARITMRLPWDIPAIESRGRPLATAVGTLSRNGETVIRSGVLEAKPGKRWEPFGFLLSERLDDDTGSIPNEFDAEHALAGELVADRSVGLASYRGQVPKVTEANWPEAAQTARGLVYPSVWGSPGLVTDANDGRNVYASPALLVHLGSAYLLIAGHRCTPRDPADTMQVQIQDSAGNVADLPVGHMTDGSGRTVAYVSIAASALSVGSSMTYSALWTNCRGLDGGVGSMCEYLLDQSSSRIDRARTRAIRDYLNRYRLAGVVDRELSPLELFRDAIQPLIPVALQVGPDGAFPVVWPMSRAHEIAERVNEGASFAFESRVDKESEIANVFSLAFAYSDAEQNGEVTTTADRSSSAQSAWSESHHGRKVEPAFSSGWIYRHDVADLVVQQIAALKADTIRRMVYRVRESTFGIGAPRELHLGDELLLTDPDRHLENVIAVVTDRAYKNDDLTLELSLRRDVTRDGYA